MPRREKRQENGEFMISNGCASEKTKVPRQNNGDKRRENEERDEAKHGLGV